LLGQALPVGAAALLQLEAVENLVRLRARVRVRG
jgi:hypothetical protein